MNRKRHHEVSEGLIDDEDNLRYVIKLLVKLREIELNRQMEKDQAEFAEKHMKKNSAASYYG